MSIYSVVLFVHIVGALSLFMALAIEWATLRQMQRVTSLVQARISVKTSSGLRPLSITSMLVVLGSGGYLASRMEAWGDPWIWATIAGMVAIGAIAVVLTNKRMEEIRRACRDENAKLTERLIGQLRNPILRDSVRLRIAVALAIVFLMVTKPNLDGALLALAIAGGAGFLPTMLKRAPLPKRGDAGQIGLSFNLEKHPWTSKQSEGILRPDWRKGDTNQQLRQSHLTSRRIAGVGLGELMPAGKLEFFHGSSAQSFKEFEDSRTRFNLRRMRALTITRRPKPGTLSDVIKMGRSRPAGAPRSSGSRQGARLQHQHRRHPCGRGNLLRRNPHRCTPAPQSTRDTWQRPRGCSYQRGGSCSVIPRW